MNTYMTLGNIAELIRKGKIDLNTVYPATDGPICLNLVKGRYRVVSGKNKLMAIKRFMIDSQITVGEFNRIMYK